MGSGSANVAFTAPQQQASLAARELDSDRRGFAEGISLLRMGAFVSHKFEEGRLWVERSIQNGAQRVGEHRAQTLLEGDSALRERAIALRGKVAAYSLSSHSPAETNAIEREGNSFFDEAAAYLGSEPPGGSPRGKKS